MRFPAGIILSLALAIAALAGAAAQTSAPTTATATFAGGCFWCVEADFDKVEGVISTTSGYIGGMAVNPTYEQVVTGRTGHTEAVEVVYDPAKVSYERLLDVFWQQPRSAREGPPVLRPRQPVSPRHLLSQRGAARARRGDQEDASGALQAADPDRDHRGDDVLQGRGLSPGLLQEESDALQVLPLQLRTRRAARRAVGQAGIVTMLTRRNLVLGSTALASAAGLWWIYGSSEAMGRFEIERSDDEWRSLLTRAQFDVLRLHRTEAPGSSPLNHEKRKGTYACAGCDAAAVLVGNQIRQPHRLAELLSAARQRARHQAGLCAAHSAHRGALPALRRASRACVRGRPAADRAALLHQRRRTDV